MTSIDGMMPVIMGTYMHYESKDIYEVVCTAYSGSETEGLTLMVVYKNVISGVHWVCTLDEFLGEVGRTDECAIHRFIRVR